MTSDVATPDLGADIRWEKWRAEAARSDRRTAAVMRTVLLILVAALGAAFLYVQFA